MLTLAPAWTELWTVEELLAQFPDFNFKGPGWYQAKNGKDWILVIPKDRIREEIWHMKCSEGEQFYFHCYNNRCPSADFYSASHAPYRS